MIHPEELLAGYVDDALSTHDRATVDSHLASCDHCQREVALARSARSALSSLEAIPAPAGLAQGAIDEAAGIRAISPSRASVTQRHYRILALTAAAAVVALLAVTLPHLGTHTTSAPRAADAGEGGFVPGVRVPDQLSLEVQHVDYDSTSVQRLAAAYSPAAFTDVSATTRKTLSSTAPGDVREAASCLDTAFPGFGGRVIRLIRATFGGRPAYIGVYIEGQGANSHPTAVSVRVASVDTCTILSFTKANL